MIDGEFSKCLQTTLFHINFGQRKFSRGIYKIYYINNKIKLNICGHRESSFEKEIYNIKYLC